MAEKNKITVQVVSTFVFSDEADIFDWLDTVNKYNDSQYDSTALFISLMHTGRTNMAYGGAIPQNTVVTIPAIFKPN